MKKITNLLKYLFLIISSFISIFPFYWMIGGATNTTNQIAQGKLTFGNQLWVNLQGLFSAYDIPLIMRNSLKISGITVILLFMMIQLAALVIPLFRIITGLQLVNEHLAIILPAINNLFLIFFFRQSFKSFPNEIIDASKIEGAVNYAIFSDDEIYLRRSRYLRVYELVE